MSQSSQSSRLFQPAQLEEEEEQDSGPWYGLEGNPGPDFEYYLNSSQEFRRIRMCPAHQVIGYSMSGQKDTPLTFDFVTFNEYKANAFARLREVYDYANPYEKMIILRAVNSIQLTHDVWIDERNADPFVLVAPCPLMLWQYLAICADTMGIMSGAEKIIAAQHTYEALVDLPF